ncbi:carboxypeptidase regulatory-like domain-containing protein [Bacteroidota bacterium]
MKSLKQILTIIVIALTGIAQAQNISEAEQQFISLEQERISKLINSHTSTWIPQEPADGLLLGDDCTNPYLIIIPSGLPFVHANNSTCGHQNIYSNIPGLGAWSNGEDYIYKLIVNEKTVVNLTMTPHHIWSCMALFDDCPDVGNLLKYVSYSQQYNLDPMTITYQLDSGEYFVMMDTWPDPECFNFDFNIDKIIINPVDVFPYYEDFESGSMPQTMLPINGSESEVTVNSQASNLSDYGLMFEGRTANGWGSTPNSVEQAFDLDRYMHHVKVDINVIPSDNSGILKMRFKLKQNYSFNANYSWLRVQVDENTITDVDGYSYYQPITHYDPFITHTFDLSAYQDNEFIVSIQSSCKYRNKYYNDQWGDAAFIDDLEIWYEATPGDLEGYTFDGAGLIVSGATIAIEGVTATQSNADGYYFLSKIPNGIKTVDVWKDGYNLMHHLVHVLPGLTTQKDFILPKPDILITPSFLENTVNPNEREKLLTEIFNSGDGTLDWYAEIIVPPTDKIVIEETNRRKVNNGQDLSPTYRRISNSNTNRNTWDVQFSFPVAVGGGEAGCESDGHFIYSSNWNTNEIHKYDLNGVYQSSFVISGVGNIKDLAYCKSNGYFYGSDGSNTLFEMNFDSEYLVNTISLPSDCRAIAYNDDSDAFYYNNWSSEITMVERVSGNYLGSFAVGSYGNFYGLAYDNWSDDGPFLWGFSQDGSGAELVQMQLPSGTQTGFTIDLKALLGSNGNAGGLFTHSGLVPGYVTVGGILQNFLVFGLELAEGNPNAEWLTLGKYSGTVYPGGGLEDIDVFFDANGKQSGEVYLADIEIYTSPDIGNFTIACLMNVLGEPLSPPENLFAELVDPFVGKVDLSWAWTPVEGFQYFVVKRDGIIIGSTINNYFSDYLPYKSTYYYTVHAVYDEGTTSPAGPYLIEWPDAELIVNSSLPLEQWIWPDTQSEIEFTISNNGTGNLHVNFPLYTALDILNDPEIEKNKTGAPFEVLELEKGQKDANAGKGNPVIRGTGGPDDFGYIWLDNEEFAVDFSWTEISQTGTEITGLDDENIVGPFPIGFDFPFYGENKNMFWINSNGIISFNDIFIPLNNIPIPTTNSSFTDFIAWFWDDLDPGNPNTHIYYQLIENKKLVIQFQNYYKFPDGGHWIDAQVNIYQSGKIYISYLYVDPGFELDSETIGIQSSDPDIGLQVAYNTAYAENLRTIMFILPSEFIVDVNPSNVIVPEGASQSIDVVYNSTAFEPGNYLEYLEGISNDEDMLDFNIPNWMNVYKPGIYAGTIISSLTDSPLPDVTVTATANERSFQTQSNSNGLYTLEVIEGTYDLSFEKLGYQTLMVLDTFVASAQFSIIDAMLTEEAYAPSWIIAEVINNDTECLVEWLDPASPYEILYEDGIAEEFLVWTYPGNENAVRFTPLAYPANIQGGRINVGDGSFPNGNWLNTKFAIIVYDDDGIGGLPQTLLDSMHVNVDNYGWVDFWGLDAMIDSGDFYMSMMQLNLSPDAAPLGVDFTNPIAYRSYSRLNQSEWSLSPYQDFMIRTFVSSPITDKISDANELLILPKIPAGLIDNIIICKNGGNPPSRSGFRKDSEIKPLKVDHSQNRDLLFYELARISDFSPDIGPQIGNIEILAKNLTGFSFIDNDYANLIEGWYAYAIRAQYSSGDVSNWKYSNIIGRKKDVKVAFEISLSDADVPSGVEINLLAEAWPYTDYFAISDSTGIIVFDSVIKGDYGVELFKIGYDKYQFTENIQDSIFYNIILLENKFKPHNFWVDPLSSWAYWDWPLVEILREDFEQNQWPPEGWQALSKGMGWIRTDNASSVNWTIPPWNSSYACSNDDLAAGSSNNACCDYLITPAVDLRQAEEFFLRFDSYFDAAYNQSAYVEYSLDAGLSWEILEEIEPGPGSWKKHQVSLSQISGSNAPANVWIAFHTSDNGSWGTGWAIDNVEISNGFADPLDFYLFIDGAFVAAVDSVDYQYSNLIYGLYYEASLAARYSSGLSEKLYYSFVSEYLIPPRNLNGETFDDAVHVWWEPPLEPAKFYLLSENVRNDQPNPATDYSPLIRDVEMQDDAIRDQWDIQFTYPVAVANGEAGLESDGIFLYSTKWDGASFYKYNLDGTYVGEFFIDGVDSIRDLAFNPNTGYMYGGKATTTCFVMDFANQILVEEFKAPTEIRAIAYDDDRDAFWANNYNNDITLFDASGYYINSFPIGSFGSYYGFAYDNWSDGGPYLWGFSQDGSAGILVQIELETGQEIFSLDVVKLLGVSEVAGGLFTQCELIYDNKVSICGMIQNELIFGLELGDCNSGMPGSVPTNLLGYNLYRDMDVIAYVPYTGIDTSHYYDMGLEPFHYQYDVTALYDLEPYGFPGDTGESGFEGSYNAHVMYGYPLPFYESWNTGSFDLNQWTNEINWKINGQIGQPEPSAEFKFTPIIFNYKSALTSYPIDGVNIADPWMDGQIYMEFDLMLKDLNQTGTESLAMEVGNENGWFRIMEFDNSQGSFEWEHFKRNISNWAFGNIFRIRFLAEGENSSNIIAWHVDNIELYKVCPGAQNLLAIQQNCVEIVLKWNSPHIAGTGSSEQWLKWDNGMLDGGLGLNGGGTFSVASRWEPQMLTAYDGSYISKLRFMPNADASASVFDIKIWTGDNAQNLIFQQEVSTYNAASWNEVNIDPPIALDVSQELWFGYTVTGPENENPAAYDEGPSIVGFGDMLNINGNWITLSGYGSQYEKNWMLRALLTYDGISDNPLTPQSLNPLTPQSLNPLTTQSPKPSRSIQGYNIYVNSIFLDYTTDTSFMHTVTNNGTYTYEVIAVYEDCEADTLAGPVLVDVACVNLKEITQTNNFSIYPNPARDVIDIFVNQKVNNLEIIDLSGRPVILVGKAFTGNLEINVGSLKQGLYIIKAEFENEECIRKLIIN